MLKPGNAFLDFLKLQDGADDNPKNAVITNLAGGWTNHEIDSRLLQTYRDVVNDDVLFKQSNKYSSSNGFSSVIEQVANYERIIFHADQLSNDEVLLGHSASNLLLNVLKATLDPGDTVLLNRPYYPNFVFQSQLLRANIEYYDTVNEDLENTINEETLIDKIRSSKCRVYLICLPDNPLGFVYSQTLLNNIATELNKQNAYLIIDYSYKVFTYEEVPKYYGNRGHENIVAVNSFSKSFVSMGRRFGYVVANKNIIDQIRYKQIVDLLCPDSLHQIVIREYLKNSLPNGSVHNYLAEVNAQYKETFNYCKSILSDEEITFADSKNGIYFYIRANKTCESMMHVLDEKQIKILSGKLYGSPDNYFRISIGPLIQDTAKLYSTLNFIVDIIK